MFNEFVDNKEILIKDLIEDVEKNCRHLSNLNVVSEYHSYKEIVEIGEQTIPYLLERIDKTVVWFNALRKIIGENPDKNHLGYMKQVTEDWKNWAKNN